MTEPRTATNGTAASDSSGTSSFEECLLRPGNTNCGGCGMSTGLTMLGRVLADLREPCMLAIPACCGIVTAGGYPTTSYGVPVVATTFASAAAVASGLASVRDLNGDPGQVICWAGDGGTYDIGLATLSAAAERNEDIIYICYDNEIYGNPGGQREGKKDIVAIMAAHRIPYAATLSVAHPDDFERKLRTAISTSGTRFLLIHSPCPTGWKSEPADSIELIRLAVDSGLFHLYEVWDGTTYRINREPSWEDPAEYYRRQGRFPLESIDLDQVRRECRDSYARLRRLAAVY